MQVTVAGVVATGLHAPWGIAFLPDGSALVSQRDDDTIVRVTPQGSVSTVGTVSGVDGVGEGGLLGIALAPAYPKDPSLYAYFTAGAQNVVARMTYAGGRLSDQRQIFGGIPSGPIHNGGRIAFGPDGMLYVGTGEAGRGAPAQDPHDLGGKILRLTPDGKPAPGNPSPGSPVWTLGHRNVQGLAWDARGRMWASEFGQNTWDELNHIVAGDNYGWPIVEGRGHQARFHDPVRVWHTASRRPAASRSRTARSSWRRCAASACGRSRCWPTGRHPARAARPAVRAAARRRGGPRRLAVGAHEQHRRPRLATRR